MKKSKKSSNKNGSSLHRGSRKSGRLILWCVSFALAFFFWLYVVGASDVPVEETFDLIEIVYDDSALAPHGLVVQSVSIDTVNVTIMGSQSDIKNARVSDISAKISLKNITEPGEYSLPVDITTPDGTTVTHQTVRNVSVTVDRPSEKVFSINSSSVEPTDYTLDSGCYLGEHTLSESVITVKGPTLVLSTISQVKVRTASIGSATNGKKVTADIVLLDASGKEINNKNLTFSDNVKSLTVTLSVYMEKTVQLTASGTHGYFGKDVFKVTPSEITLVGAPEILSGIDEINVYTIDETKTPVSDDLLAQSAGMISLPDGVTTKDGKATVEGVTVDVYLKDKIRSVEITLAASSIDVTSNYGLKATKNIKIRVYFATSSGIEDIPPSAIHAYVNAANIDKATDDVPVTVTLSESVQGYAYVLSTDVYTVDIGVPAVKDDAPSVDGGVTPLCD